MRKSDSSYHAKVWASIFFLVLIAPGALQAQVTIREKIQISPRSYPIHNRRPSAVVQSYYIVPIGFFGSQQTGTLACYMTVGRLEAPPPRTGYMTLKLHDTTHILNVSDYTVAYPVGSLYMYNNCLHRWDNWPIEYVDDFVIGGKRVCYFLTSVHEGDTVKTTYHGSAVLPLINLVDSFPHEAELSMVSSTYDSCFVGNENLPTMESGTLLLEPAPTGFAGFTLINNPDTISYGGATPVKAIALNSSGAEVQIDGGTQIRYLAGPNRLGKYKRPSGDTIAPPIVANYSDARSGKVLYISDPTIVSDTIQTSFDTVVSVTDTSKHGNGRVSISNGWTIYTQGYSTWRTTTLDSSKKGETIWGKGCAMSCLAMVLTRWGCNYTPATLNTWLNGNKGYDTNACVFWEAINKMKMVNLQYPIVGSSRPSGKITSVDSLERSLGSSTVSTIVEVKDSTYSTTLRKYVLCSHYVIVIGKNAAGQYVIIDPKYPRISTLQTYGTLTNPKGEIYRVFHYYHKSV